MISKAKVSTHQAKNLLHQANDDEGERFFKNFLDRHQMTVLTGRSPRASTAPGQNSTERFITQQTCGVRVRSHLEASQNLNETIMMLNCFRMVVFMSLLATASAALRAYPHQLAYFNELHGGLWGGHERMLHSNVDWGQDWLLCRDALFGPSRVVPHQYTFVYTLEKVGATSREHFRDYVDLRSALANDPPGTPFGLCVGWTLASEILQGPATGFSPGESDVGECLRRANGWSAVTPAIALFHCRTPGSVPDPPTAE